MRYFCFLLIVCFQLAYAESDQYPFSSATDAARFHHLSQEVRCVVCQNQSIADSNAPLAADLRKKIYAMVLQKKSSVAIKKYLVNRYGEFILLQPRFNRVTWFLWGFPFLALLIITMIFYRFFRHR